MSRGEVVSLVRVLAERDGRDPDTAEREAAFDEERDAWRAAWPEERIARETREGRAALEALGLSREPWPCLWLDADGVARAVGGSVYDAARTAVESGIATYLDCIAEGEQPPDCPLVAPAVLEGRAVGLVGDAEDVQTVMRWLCDETWVVGETAREVAL